MQESLKAINTHTCAQTRTYSPTTEVQYSHLHCIPHKFACVHVTGHNNNSNNE